MTDESDEEELERIEADISELGRQMQVKRDRALEILKGRIARVRGNRFRIDGGRIYFGGFNTRIFFEGPRLRANGKLWAVVRESAPLGLIDMIEPLAES
jgi:hypothetical protein